ncbi:ABC transporter permease [Sanguibacter sp. 25GB23B1]|uniref:ABC transporter permease n=1 Tax=unclassified Sanguibacter TaxID=2645534 RepID=UPI0032B0108F
MGTIVITPPRRFSLPGVGELWEAREVLNQFGRRDIILRYRQTAIGVTWVLLQPVVAAGIFSVVFGRVAGLDSGGVPYFLFSYMGMLAWNLFAGVITRAAPSLVSNQALVSKVFFPRMLVPLSTTLSVLLDFVVALGLGIALLVVYGVNPGWPVLLLPVWVVLMLLLGAGVGLAASAIMVKYRDVAYIVPWLVQVMLFAAPVAYALDTVPANLQTLYSLNPLTWLLEEFRWSLLGTPAPETWQIGASVVVCLGVFVAGALVFQQLEREFADVI